MFVCRKMRLQIKDAAFDEESMLKAGKHDALQRIRDEIETETRREETKLR